MQNEFSDTSNMTETFRPVPDYKRLANSVGVGSIETSETDSSHPHKVKLLSNKVYIPWYKRYIHCLPAHEQIEFQPYEEIDKREQDIAMEFVYGEDQPTTDSEKRMKQIRRAAVVQHQMYKERMDKREQLGLGLSLCPAVSGNTSASVGAAPSVNTMIVNRKTGNKLPLDFDGGKRTSAETNVVVAIAKYLNNKRSLTRRLRLQAQMKEHGFSVWNSKWGILLRPEVKRIIAKIYMVEHKAKVRARFRRMINLVFACNRFINILAELSGDTGTIVKEIRDFQNLQLAKLEQRRDYQGSAAKFIFEPKQFLLSTETPVPMDVLWTLTKPWYNRNQEEVATAIKSLQVLRCFAELPTNTQRTLAMVAWFIQIPEDKVMIRQGHESQNFYILLSGRVSKTVFVGEPHGEQPGIFRYVMSYTKDSIFGEEALTKPQSEREYSMTSCVKCDVLSINMFDYFSFTMVPSDLRSTAPDHIKFISYCDFLINFPKTKLIEDAEDNVYLSYFSPDTVIEKRMSESQFVYVIKWGTCRTLLEHAPSRKIREMHNEKLISLQMEQEGDILMEDRMTEPQTKIHASHVKTTNGSVLVRETIQAAVKNYRRNTTLEGKQLQEMAELTENRRNIAPILRVKRRKDMKKYEEDESLPRGIAIHDQEEINRTTLPSIIGRPTRGSIDNTHENSSPAVKTSTTLPSIYREQSVLNSACESESLQPSSKHRLSFSLDGVNGNTDENGGEENNDGNDDDSSESVAFESQGEKLSVIGSRCQIENLVERVFLPLEGQNQSSEPSTTSMESVERQKRNNKKKSRVSIDEQLANIQVDKTRKTYKSTGDGPTVTRKDVVQMHSVWQLMKTLIKGDQAGFEWIDLDDGLYRPPSDDMTLVSDGCELVLIRKSFIEKYMGIDARLEQFRV